MTRLGTVLRRTMRPIKDTDRFSLTPAGREALDAYDLEAVNAAETAQGVTSAVRQASNGPATGQPKPEWTRGICPLCGADVVADSYYVGGSGYLTVWECWNSLGAEPTCAHRKVL